MAGETEARKKKKKGKKKYDEKTRRKRSVGRMGCTERGLDTRGPRQKRVMRFIEGRV